MRRCSLVLGILGSLISVMGIQEPQHLSAQFLTTTSVATSQLPTLTAAPSEESLFQPDVMLIIFGDLVHVSRIYFRCDSEIEDSWSLQAHPRELATFLHSNDTCVFQSGECDG